MFLKRGLKQIILLIVITAVAIGCAPQVRREEARVIVWPLPPEPPRIKFVKSIKNNREFLGFSGKELLLGSSPVSSFRKPHGVHAKRGKVMITDTAAGVVHIFDLRLKKKSLIGGLAKPIGVTSDSMGRIYVADAQLKRIMIYDKGGSFLTAFGKKGELNNPAGIALNERLGRLYVVDSKNHQVVVYDISDGNILFRIGDRGEEEEQFNFPSNITIDKDDNVLVVDTMGARVETFDKDGNFLDSFGRLADAPGAFARPKGVAIDSEGHIYVVDAAFSNIQIFNKKGEVLLAFGGSGDRLLLPAGIAIDENDRIYVVGQWFGKINVYQFFSERYKAEHPEEMARLSKRGIGGLGEGLKIEKTSGEK